MYILSLNRNSRPSNVTDGTGIIMALIRFLNVCAGVFLNLILNRFQTGFYTFTTILFQNNIKRRPELSN